MRTVRRLRHWSAQRWRRCGCASTPHLSPTIRFLPSHILYSARLALHNATTLHSLSDTVPRGACLHTTSLPKAHPTASFFERRIAGFGDISKRQGIGETACWAYAAEVAVEAESDLRECGCGAAVVVGRVASVRCAQAVQHASVTSRHSTCARNSRGGLLLTGAQY